jgi:hypothetical protein
VLLQDPDPLTQAVSLYVISQLDVQRSQELASQEGLFAQLMQRQMA